MPRTVSIEMFNRHVIDVRAHADGVGGKTGKTLIHAHARYNLSSLNLRECRDGRAGQSWNPVSTLCAEPQLAEPAT